VFITLVLYFNSWKSTKWAPILIASSLRAGRKPRMQMMMMMMRTRCRTVSSVAWLAMHRGTDDPASLVPMPVAEGFRRQRQPIQARGQRVEQPQVGQRDGKAHDVATDVGGEDDAREDHPADIDPGEAMAGNRDLP
jgi:hypothetical protein